MTTIDTILRDARNHAERRDIEVLLCEALRVGRAYIYAHRDATPNADESARFTQMLREYRNGTPLAYVIGHRSFMNLELDVSDAVLVPRPETELLVELMVQYAPADARIVDLGTGSGAIALAIKQQLRRATVVATDICEAALAVARRNAQKYGLDIDLQRGDWYGAVSGTFDVVVSNPPYIRDGDPHLDALVDEPRLALVAGADGLAALRCVVAGAPAHLETEGWLLVEHGFDQGAPVRRLFECAGFRAVDTIRDAAGCERVTLGQR